MSERLNPKLTAVEAALASLSPTDAQLDRDQLMYAAGAQAAKSRTKHFQRFWLASTAVLVFVSCGLAGLLVTRSEPLVVERIVYRDRETNNDLAVPLHEEDFVDDSSPDDWKARFQPTAAPSQYLLLRQVVLTRGVAGLPESLPRSDSESVRAPTVSGSREMLHELLGT